ncbi:MAG: DUF4232 domain-containing protein [Acidimicrobiales bacterium]
MTAPATTAPTTSVPRVTSATCTPSDLSATVVDATGGAGHGEQTVELKNVTSTQCVMYGYPGIGLLDPSGKMQPLNVLRATGAGFADPAVPVTPVSLAPGALGSFWMEWLNVNGSVGGTLEITPPNQTTQLRVPNADIQLNVGTLTVSAVAAGVASSTQH